MNKRFTTILGLLLMLGIQTQAQEFESATDAVKNMGVGWNLGNTLDANKTDETWTTTEQHETRWGQPVTTFELMKMMNDAGFTAIRVPITWYQEIDENGTVKEAWMNRVKEVVDYVLDNGMYCIINVHHDTGAGDGAWIKASGSNYAASKEKYEGRRSDYGHFDTDGSKMAAWAKERDPVVWQQYESEFGTSGSATVTISSTGGIVLMEGMNLPGNTVNSTNYSGKFFGGVQMELTAMPVGGTIFSGWSDGSTENPHLVTVTDGLTISATFK